MLRYLLFSLLLIALLMPGCRLKPRATMPELPPEDEIAIEATALQSIHLALRTGETAKPAADSIIVRLRWRDQVIATETIGRGERWEPGRFSTVLLPLSPRIPMNQTGTLLLELAQPDAIPGRPPWTVQIEALGSLTDGRVLLLQEPTEPVRIGGDDATSAVWLLHSR